MVEFKWLIFFLAGPNLYFPSVNQASLFSYSTRITFPRFFTYTSTFSRKGKLLLKVFPGVCHKTLNSLLGLMQLTFNSAQLPYQVSGSRRTVRDLSLSGTLSQDEKSLTVRIEILLAKKNSKTSWIKFYEHVQNAHWMIISED